MPFFSIIIPVFETPLKLVEAAISSVVGQAELGDAELVIWDDGSEVEYRNELSRLFNKVSEPMPVRFGYSMINQGLPAARNQAISLSSGDWLVLLDSDDLLRPDALSQFRNCAKQNTSARMMFSDHIAVSEDAREVLLVRKKSSYYKLFRRYASTVFDPFLHSTFLFHCQVFQRSLFDELGGFSVARQSGEEVDFHLRACECIGSERLIHIPEEVYLYRNNPASVCHDAAYYATLIENISSYIVLGARRRGFDVQEARRIGRSQGLHAAHYSLSKENGELIESPWFDYSKLRVLDEVS